MSDRLPEDLPVTKFIMVGITRSKVFFLWFFLLYLFLKRGMSLEWVWRFSKLSPNSNDFILVLCCFLYCFFIFVWKRRTTLEWVWRFFKLSPNSLQTHMFSFFCFYFIFFLFYFFGKEEWYSARICNFRSHMQCVKREFGLWVGMGLIDHRRLVTHGCLQIHVYMHLANEKSYFRG